MSSVSTSISSIGPENKYSGLSLEEFQQQLNQLNTDFFKSQTKTELTASKTLLNQLVHDRQQTPEQFKIKWEKGYQGAKTGSSAAQGTDDFKQVLFPFHLSRLLIERKSELMKEISSMHAEYKNRLSQNPKKLAITLPPVIKYHPAEKYLSRMKEDLNQSRTLHPTSVAETIYGKILAVKTYVQKFKPY